jgi:hypothetical protein
MFWWTFDTLAKASNVLQLKKKKGFKGSTIKHNTWSCLPVLICVNSMLLQASVHWRQPGPFMSPDGAWTIQALTKLFRVRQAICSRVSGRVSSLTSCKCRPRYLCGFEGAAFFGDCMFRVDPSGLLTRNGSCSTQSGSVRLSGMSIKALAADVFSNLSSVRWRIGCVMKCVRTTQHVF